jgi:collagen type III alpha
MSLVDEMTAAVDGLVRRTVSPIADQVRTLLEWRASVGELRNGIDGKDGLQGKDGASGINGRDGKDGEKGERGEKGDAGQNGKDGTNGKDGAPGVNGKDGAPGIAGKDGADGLDGKDGRDGVDGKDGSQGINGKDGVGIERVEVGEKSFDLVLTDGSTAEVPLPAGLKGDPGRDGKDGAPGIEGKAGSDGLHGKDGAPGLKGDKGDTPTAEEVESIIAKMMPQMIEKRLSEVVEKAIENATPSIIARTAVLVPPGRDGVPGRPGTPGEDGKDGIDGKDGETIIGIHTEQRSAREYEFVIKTSAGEHRAPVSVPAILDAGVHRTGQSYAKGDGVTHGGNFWIAQRDNNDLPGKSDAWRLAVRKGRDGKDGDE